MPLDDIQAYLKRVKIAESSFNSEPTLELLNQLIRQHQLNIPFENISPFLGLGVELDDNALERKMVLSSRGGYCFEQNKLFQKILSLIGFATMSLTARVCPGNNEPEFNSPLTHRLLIVELNGENYLADVGFGLETPPLAVPINTDKSAVQYNETQYKISLEEHNYRLLCCFKGQWKELYRFSLTPAQEADFDMANWYLNTHPDSKFKNQLTVSKLLDDGALSIKDNVLNRYNMDGSKTTQYLDSPGQLIECLADHFSIKIKNPMHLERALKHHLLATAV